MRLPALAVPMLVASAAALLVTRQPVSDSDLFWHLANGRDVLAGTAGADHFSWTLDGRPVSLDQWIGEVLWYLAYVAGGWRGVIGLRTVTVAALVLVVLATAVASAPRRPLIAVLVALPSLTLARYAWTDRPELMGLLLFVVFLIPLRMRSERALWALPPLLLLWSNTHGSYALGLALALLALGVRVLSRRELFARAAVIAALSVLACVPTLLRERLVSTSQVWAPPREIAEWAVPDITAMPGAILAVVLVAVLVGAFVSRERDDRDLMILVPTAFISLTSARFMPFFALAAVPFLARTAAEVWQRRSPIPAADVLGARASVGAAIVLISTIGIGVLEAPSAPDLSGYPVSAVASLAAGPGTLTQYDWGGFQIWFAPRTPVFIDGRLVPYTGSILSDYRTVIGAHPGWEDVVARRGVTAMVVRPTDAIASRAAERGWRVAYADAIAVVLVR